MAFFITDGILDFLLNQRLLDMTHYIKSFIAATMDEGKKWMIISGGGGKPGGLKVDTNTKSNPFAGLQFARLYFDGFSSIEMDKPKTVIRPFIVFYIYCLQSFVFYKASFACF